MTIITGDALDLVQQVDYPIDLVATDPPYAYGGTGEEHAISATVAVVLRETALRVKPGGWMLVMCASSWRSMAYMVESVRGIMEPVRTGTWCKPRPRTKTRTSGWTWTTVHVVAMRKGKSVLPQADCPSHIACEPIRVGRRAELPPQVADWVVSPFAVPMGVMLDPFAGSGALVAAAERAGMKAIGFERNPGPKRGAK